MPCCFGSLSLLLFIRDLTIFIANRVGNKLLSLRSFHRRQSGKHRHQLHLQPQQHQPRPHPPAQPHAGNAEIRHGSAGGYQTTAAYPGAK